MRRNFSRIVQFFSLLLVVLFHTPALEGQVISLGVPEFSRDVNVLTGNEVMARLVRGAAFETLVREPVTEAGSRSYELGLADSLSVSPDQLVWAFRIMPGRKFHNLNPVLSEDAAFSLQRCMSQGVLPEVENVDTVLRESLPGIQEEWVKVTVRSLEAVKSHRFPRILAECPIIERKSSLIFGELLGVGSNYIGSGNFEIGDLVLGKELALRRAPERQTASETIVVRGFRDEKHGLTALRTGTIDVLFVTDSEVMERAGKDPSLGLSECAGSRIVLRNGLNFPCNQKAVLSSVRYAG